MRWQNRFGETVTLTDSQWQPIVEFRPAAAAMADAISAVLARPDMVTEDRAESLRRHFYQRSTLDHPYERGYLKVTVEPRPLMRLLGSVSGRFRAGSLQVIDVALVSRQPKEERRIWPRPVPGQEPM